MRRGTGYVCLFLGGLFLLLGILARPVIYHNLATVPLDQKTTLRSVGEHMTALEISKETGVRVIKDATLENYKIVLGIPGKAKGNNAFWQYVVVSKEVGGKVLDQSQEGVSFDRVSGEATNCCGDYKSVPTEADVNATKPTTHAGLFFKFPFDTQKITYQWWDGDLGRAEPMRYLRTENVQGVQTYVFQQKSGPEVYGIKQKGVPGELFNSKKPVDANLVYENTRTLYVEPNTGLIIKGVEQQNKRLEAPGHAAVPTTVGTIGYTDATIKQNIKDSSKGSMLGFIKGPLTPIGIVLGLLLIGGGMALLLVGASSRRSTPRI